MGSRLSSRDNDTTTYGGIARTQGTDILSHAQFVVKVGSHPHRPPTPDHHLHPHHHHRKGKKRSTCGDWLQAKEDDSSSQHV